MHMDLQKTMKMLQYMMVYAKPISRAEIKMANKIEARILLVILCVNWKGASFAILTCSMLPYSSLLLE